MLRYSLNVWPVAKRRQGVVVATNPSSMLRTIAHICTDVEAALVWFGGMQYAIVRGREFLDGTERYTDGTETYEGVYVEDREHGLLLLHMGFTP